MSNKINFKKAKDIEKILPKINEILFERLDGDKKLTNLLILLCGILNRTYELAETVIWSIESNRPISTASTVRGLYETLGYVTYLEMKLSRATSSNEEIREVINNALLGSRDSRTEYNQVNIMTCMDKATKVFPELRSSYEQICEVVHPNSSSHLNPFHVIEENNRNVRFEIPCYKFKNNDREIFVNHAGECCYHIIEICKRLIKKS
ncbi:hypothetical protein ACFL2R_00175 [Patescibacteria group bacterium]